jgi:hypothetical protein
MHPLLRLCLIAELVASPAQRHSLPIKLSFHILVYYLPVFCRKLSLASLIYALAACGALRTSFLAFLLLFSRVGFARLQDGLADLMDWILFWS